MDYRKLKRKNIFSKGHGVPYYRVGENMDKKFFCKCISLILILIILFNYLQFPMNSVYGAVSYSGQTATGEYTVSTKEQLNLLAQTVNSRTSYEGSTFTMTNNIVYDSSTTNNYIPIGKSGSPFKGKFDGNGFSISGININQTYEINIGVFGYIDSASITDLSLINSSITALNNVGGIVGNAQNSIVENCRNNSTIQSSERGGGIVGYGAKTSIKRSINNGDIKSFTSCVGGIVGELESTDNSYGVFNSINNIPYKTGYYVTFKIDSKGKPDDVWGRIDVGNNDSIEQIINMSKVESVEMETWQGRFYTSSYLPAGTIISIKLDCNKGATIYDYNLKEGWDGRSLITNGSALQDGRINLTN